MTLYKFLGTGHRSYHGGTGRWTLGIPQPTAAGSHA